MVVSHATQSLVRIGPRLAALALCAGLAGCVSSTGPEDAKMAEAEYGLGNDAFHRGQYREALEHVEKALDADDTNADSAYLGAMIYLVFCSQDDTSPDCRYDEAERFLRVALAAKPDMRDAKNALGVVLVHENKPLDAAKVLEPLSRDILYRSPEKAWGNLGWAYLEAGRLDDAIPALKRSVAAQPLFCVGHYRLGLAYEKKKAYGAARQSLSRALAIEEGDCSRLQAAFAARARVSVKLGKRADAVDDLERCRELGGVNSVGKECARSLQSLQ